MKQKTFLKMFASRNSAMEYMRLRNQAARLAGCRDLLAVVDGPADDFAVVDIMSAIELGGGYTWEN